MSQRRFVLLACATLVCLALGACAGTHAVPAAAPISPLRASGGVNRPEHLDKPYVVLISLDGFRPAYLQRDDVPNLRRLLQRGTRATALRPVFPSWTFPNHYSLVTGLFVDRHGIVANSFFDPVRRQTYSLSNRDAVGDGTWYRGEPIWVTAETQGMVASCVFWPGSEAAIKGIRPTDWRPYDSGVTMEARVSTIVRWLQQPAERRPHLLTLYFAEVDSASHNASLDAPAVGAAIRHAAHPRSRLRDRHVGPRNGGDERETDHQAGLTRGHVGDRAGVRGRGRQPAPARRLARAACS
jgi:hypothetical protein